MLVRSASELETYIVSVERIEEYSNVEVEVSELITSLLFKKATTRI